MYMPKDNSSQFEPPPADTHLAVCYRVIDLGTQLVEWQGQAKHQHKIMLSWELPDARMSDGRPFTISQRYTFSSSDKAKLRKDLEAWRGVPFKDSDFGPGGFDIRNVLRKGCYLQVIHRNVDGRTYANIASIMKLPKGVTVPEPENAVVFLSLDEFDQATFDALSDGLKDTIRKSPEYARLMVDGGSEPPPKEEDYGVSFDDEIPF